MGGVPFPSSRSKTNEAAKHVESPLPGRLDGGSIPPGSTPDLPALALASASGHARAAVWPIFHQVPPFIRYRGTVPSRAVRCSRAGQDPAFMFVRSGTNERSRPGLERLRAHDRRMTGLTCRPSLLRSPHRSLRRQRSHWRSLAHHRWPRPVGRRCTSPGWRPGTPCSARW